MVKDSRFERFDVSDYVREFRHRAILAEAEPIRPSHVTAESCVDDAFLKNDNERLIDLQSGCHLVEVEKTNAP